MTEITTIVGNGEYSIHFKTDNPEAYKFVQDCCRLHIDKEKSIAKKPVEKFPFYNCPSCNSGVSEHKKYCSECGQKLDWSDTE